MLVLTMKFVTDKIILMDSGMCFIYIYEYNGIYICNILLYLVRISYIFLKVKYQLMNINESVSVRQHKHPQTCEKSQLSPILALSLV